MNAKVKTSLTLLGMAVIVALVFAGLWIHYSADRSLLLMWETDPTAIMSTEMTMKVVYRPDQAGRIEAILAEAVEAARLVERDMNIHDAESELAMFNSAPAGLGVPLSPETVEVLTDASVFWEKTHGAFDVTARQLFALWKSCGRENRLPTSEERRLARNQSRWEYIEIDDAGAIKLLDTASVDLGGIAKGYAIDLATEKLIAGGCVGGVVDVGGDVRCFGQKPSRKPWRVAIDDPFQPHSGEVFAILDVRNVAVCTSGNYERFYEIRGKRYSHIINPQTGDPVDTFPSVTVVAPDARTADAWATALSVLGPEGLKLLAGTKVQAMVVIGTPEKYSWEMTDGFRSLLSYPPIGPKKKPSPAVTTAKK
jgi:thiamine biosynthesis lipoprotein